MISTGLIALFPIYEGLVGLCNKKVNWSKKDELQLEMDLQEEEKVDLTSPALDLIQKYICDGCNIRSAEVQFLGTGILGIKGMLVEHFCPITSYIALPCLSAIWVLDHHRNP